MVSRIVGHPAFLPPSFFLPILCVCCLLAMHNQSCRVTCGSRCKTSSLIHRECFALCAAEYVTTTIPSCLFQRASKPTMHGYVNRNLDPFSCGLPPMIKMHPFLLFHLHPSLTIHIHPVWTTNTNKVLALIRTVDHCPNNKTCSTCVLKKAKKSLDFFSDSLFGFDFFLDHSSVHSVLALGDPSSRYACAWLHSISLPFIRGYVLICRVWSVVY